jgi:hypothetical protein
MRYVKFTRGTRFKFSDGAEEFLWDASPLYKEMVKSGLVFEIIKCWIDDETGLPRFKFKSVDGTRWEIGGLLAFIGEIELSR